MSYENKLPQFLWFPRHGFHVNLHFMIQFFTALKFDILVLILRVHMMIIMMMTIMTMLMMMMMMIIPSVAAIKFPVGQWIDGNWQRQHVTHPLTWFLHGFIPLLSGSSSYIIFKSQFLHHNQDHHDAVYMIIRMIIILTIAIYAPFL